MASRGGIPGIQTVVVKKDRVVWQRSYGYAVLDQPGPRMAMKNDSILYTCWIDYKSIYGYRRHAVG